MNESQHIAETEAEDYANEQAETLYAQETLSPMDQDVCDALDDEFSDYLDTLDDEIDDEMVYDYPDYESDFYDD